MKPELKKLDKLLIQAATKIKAAQLRLAHETATLYQPLPGGQADFHKSEARIRLLRGGNQSGKTAGGAMELYWWATGTHPYRQTPKPPLRLLVLGVDWQHVGAVCWTKLSDVNQLSFNGVDFVDPIMPDRLIEKDGVTWLRKGDNVPSRVKLKNGTIIDFGSAEAGRKRFQGRQYHAVWIDEDMPDEQLFQEVFRGLMRFNGSLWWTATPLADAEILYDLHDMGEKGEADISISEFVISLMANPYISEEAKKAMIAAISTPEMRAVRIEGEYLVLFGRVYKEIRHDTHFVEPFPVDRHWQKYIVLDPGREFAAIWVAIDNFGDAVVYKEYYGSPDTIDEAVMAISAISEGEQFYKFLVDPSAKAHTIHERKSIQEQLAVAFKLRNLRSKRTGYVCQLANNDRAAGITAVHSWLKINETGKPKLRFFNNLEYTRYEFSKYRRPKEPLNRGLEMGDTVKKHDHLMDCIRYFVMDMPKFQQETGIITSPENASHHAYLQWEKDREHKKKMNALLNNRLGTRHTIGLSKKTE